MAYERESKEAIALKSLQSKRYPDANKDFMKNMRRLNSAVDYISGTLGQMQKGIDDANKNFIEQIQDFIADLIVVFAGGEPTGIELGDLKYILQALGALFGLNGPFPLSLIEAAFNFFFGFVVPMEQFTDLIFDTIFAWAEDFGLDPEFIQELQELAAAFGDISETIVDLFESLTNLLDIFGIFSGDFGPFGILWNAIFGLFDGIDTSGFSSILDLVTGVMTPFIDALTFIIEIVDSILEAFAGGIAEVAGILNFAKMWAIFDFTQPNWNPIAAAIEWVESVIGGAISALFGDHIPLGAISNKDKNFLSNPGPDPTLELYGWTQTGTWTIDEAESHEDAGGSFQTVANGDLKENASSKMAVEEGQEVIARTHVKWSTLTATGSPISLLIRGYAGAELAFTQTVATLAAPLAANSGFVELEGSYVVPAPVDKVIDSIQMVYAVDATATAGTIKFSNGLLTKRIRKGFFGIDLIGGLGEALEGLDIFVQDVVGYVIEAITGIFGATAGIGEFFETVWDWFEDTLATAAQAADAFFNVSDTISHIVEAIFGQISTNPNDVRSAVDKIYNDLLENTKTLQAMQAKDAGEIAVGKIVNVNFDDYPDGPMPSIFNITYTGDPGATSQIVIKNGKAQWDKASNISRNALIRYNVESTATSFQILRGTMGAAPEDSTDHGRPHFYAVARLSTDEQAAIDGGHSYVWARAWSVGAFFAYRCDIGFTIAGVEQPPFVTNIPLTWSTDMTFVVGVGTNLRQYQVFSGTKLVYTHTESLTIKGNTLATTILSSTSVRVTIPTHGWAGANIGQRVVIDNYVGTGTFPGVTLATIASIAGDDVTFTVPNTGFVAGSGTARVYLGSLEGPNYRRWGSLAQLRRETGGTPNSGGSIAACSVADNELPAVLGTTALYYRTSTANEMMFGGDNVTAVPSNFFGFVGRASRDVLTNTANGTFVIQKEGTYAVHARILLAVGMNSKARLVLLCNGIPIKWSAGVTPSNGEDLEAVWFPYLEVGDVIRLAYTKSGGNLGNLTGEATGSMTTFEISRFPDTIPTPT